jgi:hypothetical protein
MRMAEEHLNPNGCRQSPMFRPFAALIVGQGLATQTLPAVLISKSG